MIPDSRGVIYASHGNQGDQLLINSIYYACQALFQDTYNPSWDRVKYNHCFASFESEKGVYLRGLYVPLEQRIEGAVGPEETWNWWADFQGRTTSRDQLSMAQCAFVMWRDKKRSRDHFKAWIKRGLFAQNKYKNYRLPYAGTKKLLADPMTPSLLSLFIRGGEYKLAYWLLPILDLGLFVDWWLASKDAWDEKMRLLVIVIACNNVEGNVITRWALKKLFGINDSLWLELTNWCSLNGCLGLDDLLIKAMWREAKTGV